MNTSARPGHRTWQDPYPARRNPQGIDTRAQEHKSTRAREPETLRENVPLMFSCSSALVLEARKEAAVQSEGLPAHTRYFMLGVALRGTDGAEAGRLKDTLRDAVQAYCDGRPFEEENDVSEALAVIQAKWPQIRGAQLPALVQRALREPLELSGLPGERGALYLTVMSIAYYASRHSERFTLNQARIAGELTKDRGIIGSMCALGIKDGLLLEAGKIKRGNAYRWNGTSPEYRVQQREPGED
jgi:hypothetical protein